ncbi:hypothetical protein DY000_02059193 [Brassica cretica]|uniref:Uncharacterized protein n=1 Tax=Brassica cretica TaxID=69181 RepID=A0ABQ7AU56_BRACR|nr:hypothetical protein DY000_02059193 [Brassica cretica]
MLRRLFLKRRIPHLLSDSFANRFRMLKPKPFIFFMLVQRALLTELLARNERKTPLFLPTYHPVADELNVLQPPEHLDQGSPPQTHSEHGKVTSLLSYVSFS